MLEAPLVGGRKEQYAPREWLDKETVLQYDKDKSKDTTTENQLWYGDRYETWWRHQMETFSA